MTANGKDRTTPPLQPPVPIPRTGIPGAPGIIIHILLALAAVMLPLGASYFTARPALPRMAIELITVALLILMGLHLMRVCASVRGFMPLLVFGGILLVLSTGSLIPLGILLALLFVISEGALLLAVSPRRQAVWFPLVPLGAYALSVLLCGDVLLALLALLPFPAALALALGTRSSAGSTEGLTRVGVICVTSLTLGVTLVAAVAIALYRALGTLALDQLLVLIDGVRGELVDALVALEIGSGETLTRPFDEAYATDLVNTLFNILPGALVAAVNILVAISQLILHSGLKVFGFGDSVTDRVRLFRMSLVSAAVFLLAYLIAIFSSIDASTLVGTVAENIAMILQPGLALCGLLRLLARLTRRTARPGGCMLYLLLIIPCLLLSAPAVLAFYEAIAAIVSAVASRLKPPTDPV